VLAYGMAVLDVQVVDCMWCIPYFTLQIRLSHRGAVSFFCWLVVYVAGCRVPAWCGIGKGLLMYTHCACTLLTNRPSRDCLPLQYNAAGIDCACLGVTAITGWCTVHAGATDEMMMTVRSMSAGDAMPSSYMV
jgi:hypothetical protein